MADGLSTGLEGFGRALEGFGFGVRGKTPPFVEEDIARQQQALQARGLELGERRAKREEATESRQALQQQLEFALKLQQERRATDIQAAKLAVEATNLVKGKLTSPDDLAFARIVAPLFLRGLSAGGDPKAEGIDPEDAARLMAPIFSGGLSVEDLSRLYEGLTPAQLKELSGIDDPVKRSTVAEGFLKRADLQAEEGLRTKLEAGLSRGVGSTAPIPLAKASRAFGLSGREPALLGKMKKEDLLRFNILPPPEAELAGKIAEATEPTIQAAKQEVAAATGLGVELAKRQAPLTPSERAKLVDIDRLVETGELIQPPPGTTGTQAATGRFAAITEKESGQLGELMVVGQTLASLNALTGRLITATTPQEALAQGIRLHTGAFTRANALAATYQDTKKAFLGPLSRSLAKERGVLTDRDITRIDSALSSFFDTTDVRDLKAAIVNDVFEISRRASIAAVAGQPLAPFKSQVQKKLDELDRIHARALQEAVPKDQRVIRNLQTGDILIGPKTRAIPRGWEEFR